MKKLNTVVLTATAATLALGLILVPVSEAQQGRRGRGQKAPNAPAMAQRGWDRLDLTDDQKEKLKDMRQANRQAATLRRGEMASLRAQLQAEFMNDDVDEGKVRSLSKKISALRSQRDEARLEHRLAMMNLLTPEQREKAQEMRMNGPRRGGCDGPGFHEGRGGRGGRGGPGMHQGRRGRGGRGDAGFQRGFRGQGGRRDGQGPFGRGAPEDCPWGPDAPPTSEEGDDI